MSIQKFRPSIIYVNCKEFFSEDKATYILHDMTLEILYQIKLTEYKEILSSAQLIKNKEKYSSVFSISHIFNVCDQTINFVLTYT